MHWLIGIREGGKEKGVVSGHGVVAPWGFVWRGGIPDLVAPWPAFLPPVGDGVPVRILQQGGGGPVPVVVEFEAGGEPDGARLPVRAVLAARKAALLEVRIGQIAIRPLTAEMEEAIRKGRKLGRAIEAPQHRGHRVTFFTREPGVLAVGRSVLVRNDLRRTAGRDELPPFISSIILSLPGAALREFGGMVYASGDDGFAVVAMAVAEIPQPPLEVEVIRIRPDAEAILHALAEYRYARVMAAIAGGDRPGPAVRLTDVEGRVVHLHPSRLAEAVAAMRALERMDDQAVELQIWPAGCRLQGNRYLVIGGVRFHPVQ